MPGEVPGYMRDRLIPVNLMHRVRFNEGSQHVIGWAEIPRGQASTIYCRLA